MKKFRDIFPKKTFTTPVLISGALVWVFAFLVIFSWNKVEIRKIFLVCEYIALFVYIVLIRIREIKNEKK